MMSCFKRSYSYRVLVSIMILTCLWCGFILIYHPTFNDIAMDSINILKSIDHDLDNTPETPIYDVQEYWKCLFESLFINTKLHHSFSKKYNNINDCIRIDINLLVTDTKQYLTYLSISIDANDGHSYHDLISLRRMIMLLHKHSTLQLPALEYINILQLFITKEDEYLNEWRNHFPIFNIHPPRSAGTTMCFWFYKSHYQQKRLSIKMLKNQRRIIPNLEKGRNCNFGDDGLQFTNYHENITGKTCESQYKIRGLTMIARESPLYNNKNKNISHPLLCDEFVYTLPVRSPIERILSWLRADTKIEFRFTNLFALDRRQNEREQRKKHKDKHFHAFLPYFFYSLFNYTVNERPQDLIQIINPEISQKEPMNKIQIGRRNKWLRGYSSNAITKWIGYEWNYVDINGRQIVESLLISTKKFNANDIHFYNAIELLLKIDYVLPFSSYHWDISAIKATKYANKSFENIGDKNKNESIWNIFETEMNRHFNIDQDLNIFQLYELKEKGGNQNKTPSFLNLLTPYDWNTLYQQNYFDFRLYSLSKYIAQIDTEYHIHKKQIK